MGVAQETATRDLFAPPEREAEDILLELASHVYANTGLKPMSKTLFAISRLLLVVRERRHETLQNPEDVVVAYCEARGRMRFELADDFDFEGVIEQCGAALPRILQDLGAVAQLVKERDAFGLLFNTLVRGKWDSGEGLGTFLTPEEVVDAIVAMVLTDNRAASDPAADEVCVADICGGTGRFPFALAKALLEGEGTSAQVPSVFSFDQSSLATDFARLNLHFMGVDGRCDVVADSLLAPQVSALRNRCAALATNPPFGASKYEASPALHEEIHPRVLGRLSNGSSNLDPAALFLIRNLDLLRPGGVLGIVLPDGVIQSASLASALAEFEQVAGVAIDVRALVSLPSVTFAFGGTVAKTSFLIIGKGREATAQPFLLARANHVGFLKRANRRLQDPKGNDLPELVAEYQTGRGARGDRWVPSWREWDRLGLLHRRSREAATSGQKPLREYGQQVRDFTQVDPSSEDDLHVSILDVDETGLLDVLSSARNRPSSRVLRCQPGDVVISCINPRIWRAAVIPDLPGRWTCSPEFLLVRPGSGVSAWDLSLRLHHAAFKEAVQAMAGGTSSSRQRVAKDEVLRVPIPGTPLSKRRVDEHQETREKFYRTRLAEIKLYAALHEGRGDPD